MRWVQPWVLSLTPHVDFVAALGETTGRPAFHLILKRMKASPEGQVYLHLFSTNSHFKVLQFRLLCFVRVITEILFRSGFWFRNYSAIMRFWIRESLFQAFIRWGCFSSISIGDTLEFMCCFWLPFSCSIFVCGACMIHLHSSMI